MMPEGSATFGLVLGFAVACGFNLYATVALLGIGSRLGWISALPVGLRGLENGLVIGSATGLFLIEFVVDKVPYADSVWDVIHTTIRPLAATLLVGLALWDAPADVRIAGAALAGVTALVVHASKAGLRVALNSRPRPALTLGVSLLEDAAAGVFALVALVLPTVALVAAVLLLAGLFVFARGLGRAALLGVRAAVARLRGFFGSPGWHPAGRLPGPLRMLVHGDELGGPPSRATRAALLGVASAGAYRNGWLLLDRGRVAFVYRTLLRPRRVELPLSDGINMRPGLLTDIVEVGADDGRFTLFLLKDGPPPEVTLGELRAAA